MVKVFLKTRNELIKSDGTTFSNSSSLIAKIGFLETRQKTCHFHWLRIREFDRFISEKPVKNGYKCTNIVMEHDHIGHHHRPTWPHANNRLHTPMRDNSNFYDELHKRNMQALHRPSPPQATVCPSTLSQGHFIAALTPQRHGKA
jgi:hypothetical protein